MVIPHRIVQILGDGACLFRSISYLMFNNEAHAQEIRQQIVHHVVSNWQRFTHMTYNNKEETYSCANVYFRDMSLSSTYGGLCEIWAAGEIYPFVFEVFRGGQLYVKCGRAGFSIKRMRFNGSLSGGHFEVLEVADLLNLPRLLNNTLQ